MDNLTEIQPFSGVANISLDGIVVTMEGRGPVDKALVILTAGGRRVECVVGRIPEEHLREIWNKRCIVTGIGHYTEASKLPTYIEAVAIEPVPNGGSWAEWRGAFDHPRPSTNRRSPAREEGTGMSDEELDRLVERLRNRAFRLATRDMNGDGAKLATEAATAITTLHARIAELENTNDPR